MTLRFCKSHITLFQKSHKLRLLTMCLLSPPWCNQTSVCHHVKHTVWYPVTSTRLCFSFVFLFDLYLIEQLRDWQDTEGRAKGHSLKSNLDHCWGLYMYHLLYQVSYQGAHWYSSGVIYTVCCVRSQWRMTCTRMRWWIVFRRRLKIGWCLYQWANVYIRVTVLCALCHTTRMLL